MAKETMRLNNKAEPKISDLSWVHYIVYIDGPPRCIPLKDLDEVLKTPEGRKRPIRTVKFDPDLKKTLFEILKEGTDPKSSSWLTIVDDAAMSSIPQYFHIMPVLAVGKVEDLENTINEAASKVAEEALKAAQEGARESESNEFPEPTVNTGLQIMNKVRENREKGDQGKTPDLPDSKKKKYD